MRRLGSLVLVLVLSACATGSLPEPAPQQAVTGGAGPQIIPVDPGVHLIRLAMLDPEQGWAVGRDALTGGLLLLRTEDGGATWDRVAHSGLPDRVFEGAEPALGLLALSPVQVVLAAITGSEQAVVVRTDDAGQIWTRAELSLSPWQAGGLYLDFASEDDGWLLLTSGPSLGTSYKTVYRTADGGKTWEVASAGGGPGSPPAEGALPPAEYAAGISFRGKDHGWVGRIYRSDEAIFLHETRDGGRTWSKRLLPEPEDDGGWQYANTFPPRFVGPDRRQGLMLAELRGDAGAVVLYRTSDGGLTWEPGQVVANLDLGAYSLADADHGWLLDQSGTRLFATADGGRSWQRIEPDRSLSTAALIQFVDRSTGWAILAGEQSRLLKTGDGGATWAEVPLAVR